MDNKTYKIELQKRWMVTKRNLASDILWGKQFLDGCLVNLVLVIHSLNLRCYIKPNPTEPNHRWVN